jgi:hypothetical protein
MCLCAIHAVDALMTRAAQCVCDRDGTPLCAECACVFELVSAVVTWATAPEDTR